MKPIHPLSRAFVAASRVALALGLPAHALAADAGVQRAKLECHGPDRDHPPAPGAEFMALPPLPPLLRGLDLSEAQQDQAFEIFNAQARPMRDALRRAQRAQAELRALTRAEKLDDARLRSLTQQLASAHAELAALRTRGEQQLYALLSPEQRRLMAAREAERKQDGGLDPMPQGPGRGEGRRG